MTQESIATRFSAESPQEEFPRVFRFKGDEGDIDISVAPGRSFRLVFVRAHFAWPPNQSGSPTFADVILSLDSIAGDEFDTVLYTEKERGIDRDMFLVIAAEQLASPSGWSFDVGDALTIDWVNTGGAIWGVEVGIIEGR